MASLVDEASKARLQQIPADAGVVLSLHGDTTLGELPALGEGGRELGRTERSVLVEAPHSTLGSLSEVKGLSRAVIWGAGEIVRRLDPALRNQLLESVGDSGRRDHSLEMIATFDGTSDDLANELRERGVAIRSVVGSVVTLDAPPEVAFQILTMPSLANLSQPRQMRYMDQK